MGSMTVTWSEGFTREDRDALPEVPHAGKYELVDGMLVVGPAPTWRHQGVVGSLHLLLSAALAPDQRVRMAPTDVAVSDGTIVQPDLVVAPRTSATSRRFAGPLLLAVEVLSPSNRRYDEIVKRRLLQDAGCPSYWIVDPEGSVTLTVLELVDGEYAEVARVSGSQAWTATRPFAVTVVPGELLDD